MRRRPQSSMIGSLLFYALYPLSRYLAAKPPEAPEKELPPASVNGTAEWDGGAFTAKKFTQIQTGLLDRRRSPSSGTERETKKRMKEPSPQYKNDATPVSSNEQLMSALHEETSNEAAAQDDEGPSAIRGKAAEMRNGQQQDNVEAPKQDVREDANLHKVLHKKQNIEDVIIFPAEDISPEQSLEAQLQYLQTDDSTQETTCPAQKPSQTPTEESVIHAEDSIQEKTGSVQEPIQVQSGKEPVTSAETVTRATEFWDEYAAPTADQMNFGTSGSELVFASSIFNGQSYVNVSGENDEQTGWHFPVGPGLSEEVQCPLWQFPAVSYYPPLEQTFPFEVTWRLWEESEESASASEAALIPFPFSKATMNFTVMSYNILAQDLLEANPELYTHCPLEVLDWSYRSFVLIEEIQKWAPDILCLQEVQENHYHEQLHPVLSDMGYTCVYKRRTGTKTDGCATCYRSSYFSEISLTQLEFFRPETELLDRHNVGTVLLLQPVITQGSQVKVKAPPLCVANTHLLFNPRRGDVKLAQLAILLAEIDCIVKTCRVKGEHCNIILCGDFNSVPHMPLYQLITTGELYYQGLPAWMISGQEDLSHKTHCHRLLAPLWPSSLGITDNCQYTAVGDMFESHSQTPGKSQYSHNFMLQLRYCPAACVRPKDLKLIPGVTDNTPDASRGNHPCDKRFRHTIRHQLDLESVYEHILPGSGTSEVTTQSSEVGATVDYIFYSPRRILTSDQKAGGDFGNRGLKLTGRLSLLSNDALWSMKGLPNHIFPSDHLSLVAKFQLDLNAA